jgi:surface protein
MIFIILCLIFLVLLLSFLFLYDPSSPSSPSLQSSKSITKFTKSSKSSRSSKSSSEQSFAIKNNDDFKNIVNYYFTQDPTIGANLQDNGYNLLLIGDFNNSNTKGYINVYWDVSNVTNFSNTFSGYKDSEKFNQNLSSWNTENAIDTSYMFSGCKEFNQDLSSWNMGKVKTFDFMFYNCSKLNSYVLTNVGLEANSMESMFEGCFDFNRSIYSYKIPNVTNMKHMLYNCASFDVDRNNFKTWYVNTNVNLDKMLFNTKMDNDHSWKATPIYSDFWN